MEERIQWLEARRSGIGSSDAPALLGVCPWQTALDVYHTKVDTSVPVDRMSNAMEWGHRLEPVVAGKAIDSHGWTLGKPGLLRHSDYPFLLATPDRVNQFGEVVEIKTTGSRDGWGEPETDEIPMNVWVQVQHQLAVASSIDERVELAWVCVLIGGSDYRRYRVPRNPVYLETALPAYRDFWQAVESRTPPPPQWDHSNVVGSLKSLRPEDGKDAVELGDKAITLADLYASLGAEASGIRDEREAIQAKLIELLGTASVGLLPDGRRITRREVTRKAYHVEETTYVDFRISRAAKDRIHDN